MKVLFVDLLLKYINPTRNLIPQLFSTMETRFFGPGYVSSDCLSAGLASFIEKNGPFDVVVVSEHIAFSKINNFVNTYQAFRKNYAIEFPKTELRETEKLFEAVKKLNICKVIITLESDYYNFTPGHISVGGLSGVRCGLIRHLTFESVQIKSRFGVSNRYRGARLRLSSSAFK